MGGEVGNDILRRIIQIQAIQPAREDVSVNMSPPSISLRAPASVSILHLQIGEDWMTDG